MTKKLSLLILFICIITVAYFNSRDIKINDKFVSRFPVITEEVEATTSDVTEDEEIALPSLEMELVDTKEYDQTFVETYREIEIYKDKEGNITKKIPTDHYSYLQYDK